MEAPKTLKRPKNVKGAVVPATLPPEIAKILKQALHQEQIEKGYHWILEKMSDKHPPLELMDAFLKRYEEQIMQLKGETLEEYGPVFRAALAAGCLKILPFFQTGFANKAFNPLFVHTHLQRRILEALLGLSPRDIELKIRLSGRTPKLFLTDTLDQLVPQTFLKNYL
jgi:hypothetical protein